MTHEINRRRVLKGGATAAAALGAQYVPPMPGGQRPPAAAPSVLSIAGAAGFQYQPPAVQSRFEQRGLQAVITMPQIGNVNGDSGKRFVLDQPALGMGLLMWEDPGIVVACFVIQNGQATQLMSDSTGLLHEVPSIGNGSPSVTVSGGQQRWVSLKDYHGPGAPTADGHPKRFRVGAFGPMSSVAQGGGRPRLVPGGPDYSSGGATAGSRIKGPIAFCIFQVALKGRRIPLPRTTVTMSNLEFSVDGVDGVPSDWQEFSSYMEKQPPVVRGQMTYGRLSFEVDPRGISLSGTSGPPTVSR